MKPYIKAAERLEQLIDMVTPATASDVCALLDEFWKKYCEINVRVCWILTFTRHNHAAKDAWGNLDHKLRRKLKEFRKIY